ncbi:hypothetical protein Pth03_09930 [Planotetraspora thailandica]|uniref:WXG100 family type VII secretion target n=1 Tax=Planotetraspora thailandica TaxID=487172 RepID=A0A8J3V224_9ACTN|nr:hypothetical protein [Planotetraspora thailandica]GII52604.1 hypothetical protein Pth03_09930 [Planotetraspora thailandica]
MPKSIILDFDDVLEVSQRLDSAKEHIVPMLTELQNRIHAMCGESFVFPESSVATQETYDKFNTGLTSAMEGISGFASMFRDVLNSMQEMDRNLAGELRKNG